jgi:S1-C subfamily serine protease
VQDVVQERPDSKPQIQLGGTLAGGALTQPEWDAMVKRITLSAFKIIAMTCNGTETASGSGFSVGRLVVTNQHVVEGAERLALIYPDQSKVEVSRWIEAGSDDLALIEPLDPLGVPPIVLASEDPSSGDLIAAVGYPLGGTLTTRRAKVLQQVEKQDLSATYALSTSASVQPGDSGGVLVNAEGKVVGVTTAIALKENVSLAVPVSRLQHFIDNFSFTNANTPCN